MARDNFKKNTIRILRERVAHRCSNPECRVPTIGPAQTDKASCIGVAANISAASKGGPRFNESLSAKERSSLENGIWLCQNCSVEIDRDERRYTVDILREWKKQGEQSASLEKGRQLPSEESTVQTLKMALTGYPQSYLSTAIQNTHTATRRALSELDPRFCVETRYSNGESSILVYAKQPIDPPISFQLKNSISDEITQCIAHGRDIRISTSEILVEGSDLLEMLVKSGGTFVIPAEKKTATLYLHFSTGDSVKSVNSQAIEGVLVYGTETATFYAQQFDGKLSFTLEIHHSKKPAQSRLNISISYASWNGCDITKLPHLFGMYSFFFAAASADSLKVALEIEGTILAQANAVDTEALAFMRATNNFLTYTKCAAGVSKLLGKCISFSESIAYSAEQYVDIINASVAFAGKREIENITRISFSISPNADETARVSNQSTDSIIIKIVLDERELLNIFDQVVELPRKTVEICAKDRNISQRILEAKEGDVIQVTIDGEDIVYANETYTSKCS